MAFPSIYPTGTTIYNSKKAYSGYTVFPSNKGALLIDMNGREVKLWAGLGGFPNKILPGGYVVGTTGRRSCNVHSAQWRRCKNRWIVCCDTVC